MGKRAIILSWILEQVQAGKIKPPEGIRLAQLVDMHDAPESAKEIARIINASNDFRYLNVGAKKDTRGISGRYDADIMSDAISSRLRLSMPSPHVLAWYAVALIKTGVLEEGIKKIQARRVLLLLDSDRQKAWGSTSAFNTAFFNSWADMDIPEANWFIREIMAEYSKDIKKKR